MKIVLLFLWNFLSRLVIGRILATLGRQVFPPKADKHPGNQSREQVAKQIIQILCRVRLARLGRQVFILEIRGSNPLRGTKKKIRINN